MRNTPLSATYLLAYGDASLYTIQECGLQGYLIAGFVWCSVYRDGRKYREARMQPLTRGPEADETKTMAVTLPQRV